MSDLRWLLDNVPEDSIEEHALTIEDAIKENAVLKDEIRRHEKVFQFSAERIATLKRKVELAIERIRAEDDPDIGKPWLVEHVLAILTAEEQRSETE